MKSHLQMYQHYYNQKYCINYKTALSNYINFACPNMGAEPNNKFAEVTTHNIYFHEESPILSIDGIDDVIATCGFDNTIRIWTSNFGKMKCAENIYRTASNSSISFDLLAELKGFDRPVNCLRFMKDKKNNLRVLAACADGGRINVYIGETPIQIRGADGDDAYDMAWDCGLLIIGFSSGHVEIYNIEEKNEDDNTQRYNFKLFLRQKIHDSTIQGVSVCRGLIATHGLDKKVKVHAISDKTLKLVTYFDKKIDNSRGLFKRLLLNETKLYVFIKSNIINVYSYPYRDVHLHKKISTLNAPPIKIIENNNMLFICTKKSVYILQDNEIMYSIDNCCYMAVTDAYWNDNFKTLFLSSMDGFIATIRLNTEKSF